MCVGTVYSAMNGMFPKQVNALYACIKPPTYTPLLVFVEEKKHRYYRFILHGFPSSR